MLSIVTTSWDDGDARDLRLAEMLSRSGVKGTFYIPTRYAPASSMDIAAQRSLLAAGFEIGSHGVTHVRLGASPDPMRELTDSRRHLEDTLGRGVWSFCYPLGDFNPRTAAMVRRAGYLLARTTVGLRTGTRFNRFQMPVSMQFYPHPRQILLRHELRGGNLRGISAWMRKWSMKSRPLALARVMFEDVAANGGVFHLWGHSWEIEQQGSWRELEDLLKVISRRPGVEYLSNLDALSALTNENTDNPQ
jgi:polysaccharide deacetylase